VSCIDLFVQLLSHAVIDMLILLCANKHGWMDGCYNSPNQWNLENVSTGATDAVFSSLKMRQNHFRPGLRPGPCWTSLPIPYSIDAVLVSAPRSPIMLSPLLPFSQFDHRTMGLNSDKTFKVFVLIRPTLYHWTVVI